MRVRIELRPVKGWIKRTTDRGEPSILLAEAGFSREALLAAAASASPRIRTSALAG
jgi:hypothetical protein